MDPDPMSGELTPGAQKYAALKEMIAGEDYSEAERMILENMAANLAGVLDEPDADRRANILIDYVASIVVSVFNMNRRRVEDDGPDDFWPGQYL